jgi:hypothetical protein
VSQRDLVLRWIEQVGRVVARLLHGRGGGDLELAGEQVQDAIGLLLGPLAALLPRLEPASAAELLADPERIFGYARLLALQAAVEQAAGRPAAGHSRDRALALAREALRRSGEPRPEWESWVSLAEQDPP